MYKYDPSRGTDSLSSKNLSPAMSEPTLVLYDVYTLRGTLSPFVWKTRLELNYKKQNFKTESLTFVNIRPTYEKLGLPPSEHPVEKPYYSVPALIDTSTTPHTQIVDSSKIEKYLDETYPDPPLYAVRPPGCSDADWEKKQAAFAEADDFLVRNPNPKFRSILGFLIPNLVKCVKEEDVEYFKESRSKWFQKSFDDIAYKEDEVEAKIGDLKEAFTQLEEIFERARGKPFNAADPNDKPWLLGDVVSRVDFAVMGQFLLISKTCPDLWDKIKTWGNGRWNRMLELSVEWQ